MEEKAESAGGLGFAMLNFVRLRRGEKEKEKEKEGVTMISESGQGTGSNGNITVSRKGSQEFKTKASIDTGLEVVVEGAEERMGDGQGGQENPEEKEDRSSRVGSEQAQRKGSISSSITSTIRRAVRSSFAPRMSFTTHARRSSASTNTNSNTSMVVPRSSHPSMTQAPTGGGIILTPLSGVGSGVITNHAKVFVTEDSGSIPPASSSGSIAAGSSSLDEILARSQEALEAATATTKALMDLQGSGKSSVLVSVPTGEEEEASEHSALITPVAGGGGSGGRVRGSGGSFGVFGKEKDKEKERDRKSLSSSTEGTPRVSSINAVKRGERRSFTGKSSPDRMKDSENERKKKGGNICKLN